MQTSRLTVQAGRLAGALCVPLLIMTGAQLARGQTSATTRDGWVLGALVGRMRIADVPDGHGTIIGVGATRFAPQRPGVDLAVVTIPRLFRDGQIPVHALMGVAVPVRLAHSLFLVPTFGVDAAGLAGQSDGGWVGYHCAARALFVTRDFGVQAGVVWARAFNAPNSLWLTEVGLMRVPLPSSPKQRPASPVPDDI